MLSIQALTLNAALLFSTKLTDILRTFAMKKNIELSEEIMFQKQLDHLLERINPMLYRTIVQ